MHPNMAVNNLITNDLNSINLYLSLQNSINALKNLSMMNCYQSYTNSFGLSSPQPINNSLYQGSVSSADYFRQLTMLNFEGLREDSEKINTGLSYYNCDSNVIPDFRKNSTNANTYQAISDQYKTLTQCSIENLYGMPPFLNYNNLYYDNDIRKTDNTNIIRFDKISPNKEATQLLSKKREKSIYYNS